MSPPFSQSRLLVIEAIVFKARTGLAPYPVPSNHVPVQIQQDHVTRLDHPEVDGQRIHPEGIFALRVADADMAADPVVEAVPSEDSKCARQVLELPFSLFRVRRKLGDAGERNTLMAHGLDRRQCWRIQDIVGNWGGECFDLDLGGREKMGHGRWTHVCKLHSEKVQDGPELV